MLIYLSKGETGTRTLLLKTAKTILVTSYSNQKWIWRGGRGKKMQLLVSTGPSDGDGVSCWYHLSYSQHKISSKITLRATWSSVIKLTTAWIHCGDSFCPENTSWKGDAVRQKESRESSNWAMVSLQARAWDSPAPCLVLRLPLLKLTGWLVQLKIMVLEHKQCFCWHTTVRIWLCLFYFSAA